jgi:hypothetical protein
MWGVSRNSIPHKREYKMSVPALVIVYEGNNRLVALATVTDRELLVCAAEAAIREAAAKASRETDEVLAEIQKQDAVRLWRLLQRLIPELIARENSGLFLM